MPDTRFVYLGTPEFSATILRSLIDARWKPVLVVTEPDRPAGRELEPNPSAVSNLATELGLTIVKPETKTELFSTIQAHGPLDLLVVAAYGKILPTELLDFPQHGAINVHASILPKHRGASPIQAAILAGDTETGISFMQMEPTLDTGPVLDLFRVPINPTDTTQTLTKKLAGIAVQHIVPVLQSCLSHASTPTQQVDARATYAPKLTKADGRVDLTTVDPITLDRMLRAYTPWPGVYSDEFSSGITRSSATDQSGPESPRSARGGQQRLIIRKGYLDGNGNAYVITELQWAGKRPVDGATFARAYPEILTQIPSSIRLGPEFD